MEKQIQTTDNEWAIDWDDCEGEDIPGTEDLLEIFVDVVHSCFIK